MLFQFRILRHHDLRSGILPKSHSLPSRFVWVWAFHGFAAVRAQPSQFIALDELRLWFLSGEVVRGVAFRATHPFGRFTILINVVVVVVVTAEHFTHLVDCILRFIEEIFDYRLVRGFIVLLLELGTCPHSKCLVQLLSHIRRNGDGDRLDFVIFRQICIYIWIVGVDWEQIAFVGQQVEWDHTPSIQLTCLIFKVPTLGIPSEFVWFRLIVAQQFVNFEFFTRNFVLNAYFIR